MVQHDTKHQRDLQQRRQCRHQNPAFQLGYRPLCSPNWVSPKPFTRRKRCNLGPIRWASIWSLRGAGSMGHLWSLRLGQAVQSSFSRYTGIIHIAKTCIGARYFPVVQTYLPSGEHGSTQQGALHVLDTSQPETDHLCSGCRLHPADCDHDLSSGAPGRHGQGCQGGLGPPPP